MRRLMVLVGICGLIVGGCSAADPVGDGGSDVEESIDISVVDASTEDAQCTSDSDCDDQNPCTEGVCAVDGSCRQIPQVGALCDDGSACTEGETCQADGECAGGLDVTSSDDPCQVCSCDPKEGVTCAPRNEGDSCSDSDCCTLGDACLACDPENDPGCADYGLKCVGSPKSCEDDNACTLDVCQCEGETVTCTNDDAPDGFPCDYSSNDCTMGDSCLAGQCILSPPLDLDDQNPCTEDKCEKGEVVHTFLLTGQCDDGDECTMDDRCELGACVGGEIVQCAQGPCESSTSCVPGQGCTGVPKPEGASCDDDNPCTLGEICTAEQTCVSEEFVDCNDGNPCTADSCDANSGDCLNEVSELLDGLPCVPADASCANEGLCAAGVCVPDEGEDCDDQNPCTTDTCDEAGGCKYLPAEGSCDDGNPCTVDDLCVAGACEPGAWADTEACNPPPACIEGDTVVNCSQTNDLDSDGCCCFAEDPTGAHQSGHVLDLGEVEPGTEIECCIQPGYSSGCEDTAFIDASLDGVAWTTLSSFPTTSTKNDAGAWVTQCVTVSADEAIRYVRGANDECYVDFFQCTVICEEEGFDCDNADCDDQNPCTEDSCDSTLGCVSAPDIAMEGSACLPQSACASSGVCHDGECVSSSPEVDCDDGDPCTEDTCNDETGCEHTAIVDCEVPLCSSQAAEFDGQSCIQVPDFLDEGVPSYTIEFWFQPFANDTQACVLDKVTGTGMSDAPGWMVRYNDLPAVWESSLHYQEASLDGNFHGLLTTDAYVPGEWHHYAIVRQENGLLRRFIDGVGGGLNSMNNEQFVAIQMSPDPMWIGCRDNDIHFLNGRIDELRISAGERYSGNFAPPTSALENDEMTLLLYHFEGPTDGVVVDSSGLGHDGLWSGTDIRPAVSPVQSCDDGDPCTLDTCEDDGCQHIENPCDDGDPCTLDTCDEGGCQHSEDLSLAACVASEPCVSGDTINCQDLDVPGDECCCGNTQHTLDLEVMVAADTEMSCCIRPGINCFCTGDAVFEVSKDGIVWETVATFETETEKVDDSCVETGSANHSVAWKSFCEPFSASEAFRFVRGSHATCKNDYFECTLPSTDCDDQNPCTLDSCDEETDTCVHIPNEDDDACLVVYHGNNLVGFHALPSDNATVPAVFGELADHAVQLWSEGVVAHRLSDGTWVGNYRELEAWRGYWLVMDLSEGNFHDPVGKPKVTAIPLSGDITPPDLRYTLHGGLNMISFSGAEDTDITGAVEIADQGLFEFFIGASVGLFKDDFGAWIGNLTFTNWRGYEAKVLDDLAPFTFMWGVDAETPSDLVYGCTDPNATNHDANAQVDDRSCVYDVPEGWTVPTWVTIDTMTRPQMFVVFQGLSASDAPMEGGDAVGAFVEGQNVGFGFADAAGYVTIPVMNSAQGADVSFKRYDQSEGSVHEVEVSTPVSFSNHHVIVIGCTDEVASNYLSDAVIDGQNCEI